MVALVANNLFYLYKGNGAQERIGAFKHRFSTKRLILVFFQTNLGTYPTLSTGMQPYMEDSLTWQQGSSEPAQHLAAPHGPSSTP